MKAELLKGVKLHKTEVKDRSRPDLNQQSEHDFLEKIHSLNLENWYPLLSRFTFNTQFVDLSQIQARALVREHERVASIKAHEGEKENDKQTISNLENEINTKVATFGSDVGAFIRLSTRSPKDATLNHSKTNELFEQELDLLGDKREDENSRLIALIKSSINSLKVFSGKEALDLIIASERSYEDLVLALDFPESWDMKVIIREWVSIDPSMEFRGFVCDKKLTALSQYFYLAFFEHLPDLKDKVLKLIQELFDKVVNLVELDTYVIDFAVFPEKDEVFVIEINPFKDFEGCGTDPGMFSWENDRAVLDGESAFEFRIQEG
eukprot:CAMPEP_0174251732 /NCGR_PEP_ID=MMETSP0439-20130205/1466_1 /TAXON_ID=0 /ORGANISM="Stereomyxa ramosa, Strain Chinc5" /LENGTH=321 /DNA_ID=CAMNT_0015332129 /DNA_START=15 /DNA_END=976 /DNA_ORIENTATION=-